MEVKKSTVEIKPAVPAVTEDRFTVHLTAREAQMLGEFLYQIGGIGERRDLCSKLGSELLYMEQKNSCVSVMNELLVDSHGNPRGPIYVYDSPEEAKDRDLAWNNYNREILRTKGSDRT